ncbi:hypothetical protein D3C87_1442750 [compost metagenome]
MDPVNQDFTELKMADRCSASKVFPTLFEARPTSVLVKNPDPLNKVVFMINGRIIDIRLLLMFSLSSIFSKAEELAYFLIRPPIVNCFR